jgi:hypothetical protein
VSAVAEKNEDRLGEKGVERAGEQRKIGVAKGRNKRRSRNWQWLRREGIMGAGDALGDPNAIRDNGLWLKDEVGSSCAQFPLDLLDGREGAFEFLG